MRLPFPLQPFEDLQHRGPDGLHPLREVAVVAHLVHLPLLLRRKQVLHALADAVDRLHEQPDRAAVHGHPLDLVQVQPVAAEQLVQRRHGEVAQMLMIDRVELAVVNEVHQIRTLDHRHAVILEDDPDALDEPVEVRHVRQHVVRQEHIGGLPFFLPETA